MLEDFIDGKNMVKVIDFFLDEPELDYSRQELIKNTKVTWKAINEIVPKLVKYGVIAESRTIRGSTLYKLNKESDLFQELLKLDKVLNVNIADEYLANSTVKH